MSSWSWGRGRGRGRGKGRGKGSFSSTSSSSQGPLPAGAVVVPPHAPMDRFFTSSMLRVNKVLAKIHEKAKDLQEELNQAKAYAAAQCADLRSQLDMKTAEAQRLTTELRNAKNASVLARANCACLLTDCKKQMILESCMQLWRCNVTSAKQQHKCRQEAAATVQRHVCNSQWWLLKATVQAWRYTLSEALGQQLASTTKTLTSLRQDLAECFTCPISYTYLREPVMGTDCVTYERDQIERYLKDKERSPWTRAPMRASMLRPNKLAQDLMDIVQKHLPEVQAYAKERPPAADHSSDLLTAMQRRRAEEAEELVGGTVSDRSLNSVYKIKGQNMTLLDLAMSWDLPTVAAAVARRPDYRRMESKSKTGLLSIHLATFHNYPEVGKAIIKDLGSTVLQMKTAKAVTLVTHGGESVELQRGLTPVEILRQMGYDTSWATGAAV